MRDEALAFYQERGEEKPQMREKKGWRKLRAGCVTVAGVMAAIYWTLRTVQAGIDLYGATGHWA